MSYSKKNNDSLQIAPDNVHHCHGPNLPATPRPPTRLLHQPRQLCSYLHNSSRPLAINPGNRPTAHLPSLLGLHITITQVSRSTPPFPYLSAVLLQHPLLQFCLFLTHTMNTILMHPHDTMLMALLIISSIPGHCDKLHVLSLATVDCRSSAWKLTLLLYLLLGTGL
jgi:hypothetical protein